MVPSNFHRESNQHNFPSLTPRLISVLPPNKHHSRPPLRPQSIHWVFAPNGLLNPQNLRPLGSLGHGFLRCIRGRAYASPLSLAFVAIRAALDFPNAVLECNQGYSMPEFRNDICIWDDYALFLEEAQYDAQDFIIGLLGPAHSGVEGFCGGRGFEAVAVAEGDV